MPICRNRSAYITHGNCKPACIDLSVGIHIKLFLGELARRKNNAVLLTQIVFGLQCLDRVINGAERNMEHPRLFGAWRSGCSCPEYSLLQFCQIAKLDKLFHDDLCPDYLPTDWNAPPITQHIFYASSSRCPVILQRKSLSYPVWYDQASFEHPAPAFRTATQQLPLCVGKCAV